MAELVPVIWWFFTVSTSLSYLEMAKLSIQQHCQIIPDDLGVEETVHPSSITKISAQAFTPILGTFLLSPSGKVGGAARYAVVDILCKIRKVDKREVRTRNSDGSPHPSHSPDGSGTESDSDEETDLAVGLFGPEERAMLKHELLHQVVIGIGRLDVDGLPDEADTRVSHGNSSIDSASQQARGPAIEVVSPDEQGDEERVSTPDMAGTPEREEASGKQATIENINPYFPVLPTPYFDPSPTSSNASTPSTDTTGSSRTSSSPSNTPPILETTPSEETPEVFYTPSFEVPSTPEASASRRHQDVSLGSYSSMSSEATQTSGPSRDISSNDWAPSPRSVSTVSQAPRSPSALAPSPPPSTSGRSVFSVGDSDSQGNSSVIDEDEDSQASLGRHASMSLIAAVTARGKYLLDLV